MAARKNKTLSTTSVGKYFTINCRPSYSLGLGEEESAVDVSSHGSLGDDGSDGTPEGAEEKMKNKPTPSKVGGSLPAKSSKRGQQPLILDDSCRERVLFQKAQALGLVSRDWTHIPLLKRTASDQTNASLPQTKRETINCILRDQSLRKGEKNVSRQRISCEKEKATGRNARGKLDKLRSIYEVGCCKGGPNRHQQTSGRQRCETRRPATQCNDVEYDHKGHRPKYLSRPATKLGKKMRPALQCEESQYWKEIPNRGHSQSQTGTGTCLGVDSIKSSMDCRPSQNTKAFPTVQNSSQYPQTPLAAKIELSGSYRCYGIHTSRSPTHRLSAFSRKTRKRSLVEPRTHYTNT